MKALKITTDNEISVIELEPPHHRSLNEALDGRVEVVHPRGLKPPYSMLVDEIGCMKSKPLNTVGCVLYDTFIHGEPIVGDIVITREEDGPDGRDLAGLNDRDIELLTGYANKILQRVVFLG